MDGVRSLLAQMVTDGELVKTEEPIDPTDVGYDRGQGFRCVCPSGDNGLHSCEKRTRIEGSASFVTGAFGLACASVAVRALIGR